MNVGQAVMYNLAADDGCLPYMPTDAMHVEFYLLMIISFGLFLGNIIMVSDLDLESFFQNGCQLADSQHVIRQAEAHPDGRAISGMPVKEIGTHMVRGKEPQIMLGLADAVAAGATMAFLCYFQIGPGRAVFRNQPNFAFGAPTMDADPERTDLCQLLGLGIDQRIAQIGHRLAMLAIIAFA